jgi:hypothetical protein
VTPPPTPLPTAPTGKLANIGARGIRRRRRTGVAWLVIGMVAAAAMLAGGAPSILTLLLIVPFTLAPLGLLQAREKT